MQKRIIAYFPAAFSLKPEDNPCAGNDVVTGACDEAGLPRYVIFQFQTQGKVTLQYEVGPASVFPGELITVVRLDLA